MSAPENFPDPGPEDPGAHQLFKPIDVNELAREGTKHTIVKIVCWGLLLEFPAAILGGLLGVPWGVLKDFLALAVAPVVGIAGSIGFSYFK